MSFEQKDTGYSPSADQWWDLKPLPDTELNPGNDTVRIYIAYWGDGTMNLDITALFQGNSRGQRIDLKMTPQDMLDMATVMMYKAEQALERKPTNG